LEVDLDSIKADIAKFKAYMGVENLRDIPASKVRQAFEAIARRKAGGK